jgi:hypothetical protein
MGSPPLTRRRRAPPGRLGQSLGPMETFQIQLTCDAGGSERRRQLLCESQLGFAVRELLGAHPCHRCIRVCAARRGRPPTLCNHLTLLP